jgi:hypothetical protein
MKIADLLRHLADVVDHGSNAEGDDYQQPVEVQSDFGELAPQRMVPPLQLKLELLKRAVDVNNIYSPDVPDQDGGLPPHRLSVSRMSGDQDEPEHEDVVPEPEDDVDQLRRRLAAMLQVNAGGDGPLDD